MPVVPRLEPQIRQEGMPNVRVNTDAPLEAFGGGQAVDRFTQSVGHLGDVANKMYLEEKKKADDAATMDAYKQTVELKNELFWNEQSGAMNKRGKEAFGSEEIYVPEFDRKVQEIENTLANDEQRQMFAKIKMNQRLELQDNLKKHIFQESRKYEEQSAQSAVFAAKNDAVLNYNNPEAIAKNIGLQASILTSYGAKTGMGKDAIDQAILKATTDTHGDIISRMISNGQSAQAKAHFDEALKAKQLSPDAIPQLEKAIEDGQTLDIGVSTWDKVKGMLLPDGSPDEGRMQASIMSTPGMSTKQKEKVWDFVKSRAGEYVANKNRQDAAAEKQFLNEAINARKNGQPLEEVIRLAQNKFKDPYDQMIKIEAAKKIYQPPTDSDPGTYITLWEKVHDRSATKDEIDKAMTSNMISHSDWRKLREDYWRVNQEGKDPIEKANWERIKVLADQKFSNSTEKAAFMYQIHVLGQKKTPEEIFKIANDQIQKVPGTGWIWDDPKWKIDLEKMDANNLAWGKLYQDVGKDEITAIGKGLRKSTPWGVSDVDAFASEVGGYDQLKKGTPTHNAVQSLMKHKQLVTSANIKEVLRRFPDGKY